MHETMIAVALALALAACGGGPEGREDVDDDDDVAVDLAHDEDAAQEPGVDAAADTECAVDADCDDFDPCTADTCDGDGDCVHAPLDADGDGYVSGECGGTDCDDGDAALGPAQCEGVNECCDGCLRRGGCWIDPTTGLMWEDPPLGGTRNHPGAIDYCASLSLAGHAAGQWRLPTISELRTLVRGCPDMEDGGACGLTDACLGLDCLDGCHYCSTVGPGAGGCFWDPALAGACDPFPHWSSSRQADDETRVYCILLSRAQVYVEIADEFLDFVRCVRPAT